MKKLVISYFYPFNKEITGITQAKRILNGKSYVDLVSANKNILTDYIRNHFFIESKFEKYSPRMNTSKNILDFINTGYDLVDKDYTHIYSRSWPIHNHFLALKYKLEHKDVFWTAEFSDPILYNVSHNVRKSSENFKLDLINSELSKLNMDLIKNPVNLYGLCKYLTFVFADEIVFTNSNQRKLMLEGYSQEFYDKSAVRMHPTLDEKYYHLKNADLNLNSNFINIAYFGSYYYSRRHFESLFYAYESLNHKFKNRIRFYFFLSNVHLFEKLTKDLSFNVFVKKPMDYFDFLNASTKFDILIVNDMITDGVWKINPYLPSKLSDYLGSKSDIWAFYEQDSILSQFNTEYSSDIMDYDGCRNTLIDILNDYNLADENYSFNDDYLFHRLTSLNESFEKEYKLARKLKRQKGNIKKSGFKDKFRKLF